MKRLCIATSIIENDKIRNDSYAYDNISKLDSTSHSEGRHIVTQNWPDKSVGSNVGKLWFYHNLTSIFSATKQQLWSCPFTALDTTTFNLHHTQILCGRYVSQTCLHTHVRAAEVLATNLKSEIHRLLRCVWIRLWMYTSNTSGSETLRSLLYRNPSNVATNFRLSHTQMSSGIRSEWWNGNWN